ncbi:Restriction endonuclease type II protein [Salix suchowensis]|nr:Restriction endonuclease type II protein [Salix suchowensis]
MKLIQLSSIQSRCGFRRNNPPNKGTINSLIFLAMSKACLTLFPSIPHKKFASLSPGKRHGTGSCRIFYTSSEPAVSRTAPPIVHSPSSLVLAACVTGSDAPQRSEECTFSTALGFWKGKRRPELWHEKVFESETQTPEASANSAMQWGVLNEAAAINRYKNITGREVNSLGFAIHSEEQLDWLGASPDGLLGASPDGLLGASPDGLSGCLHGGGVLEVKCPYNKGKPEKGLPWSTMPFYYVPQVQGQLEIMDREWADLYCWTPNGSTIFRVCRDRGYWEVIHGILREFWWENVVPAREALLLGREEEAKSYMPASTHKQTGLAIVKSLKLATESKLLCREIAGHVEFFR